MNLKVVLPPVIIVVLGLGAVSSVQNTGFREHIESTLTESAQGALSAAGIDADVAFSGRDADVTAPSDAVALEAADVGGGVTGVRAAAAYGPDGLVPADAEADTEEAAEAAEEETEAASEAAEASEATDEATASPEATEATSDNDPADATEDDATEDEPKREPTREEREEAQEDLVEIPNITFVTDSAKLTRDGREVVREAAEVLEKHPEVEVRIEGHTDSRGTSRDNKELSERRADEVLDRLVELGVDEDRLTAKGYGESDPLVVPKTFADLEKNRRVEFIVQN